MLDEGKVNNFWDSFGIMSILSSFEVIHRCRYKIPLKLVRYVLCKKKKLVRYAHCSPQYNLDSNPVVCPVQVVSVAWTSKLGGWVLRALPRTGSRLWKEHISLIGYERNISTLTHSLSLPELLYFDRKKQNQRNIIYYSNETFISLSLQKWLEKSRLGSHFKLKQVWYCWGR